MGRYIYPFPSSFSPFGVWLDLGLEFVVCLPRLALNCFETLSPKTFGEKYIRLVLALLKSYRDELLGIESYNI